jgi:hypothetical protein
MLCDSRCRRIEFLSLLLCLSTFSRLPQSFDACCPRYQKKGYETAVEEQEPGLCFYERSLRQRSLLGITLFILRCFSCMPRNPAGNRLGLTNTNRHRIPRTRARVSRPGAAQAVLKLGFNIGCVSNRAAASCLAFKIAAILNWFTWRLLVHRRRLQRKSLCARGCE